MTACGRTRLMLLRVFFLILPVISTADSADKHKGIECKGNSPGKYSLHADCSSYIICLSNSSHMVKFCPPGKLFNALLRTCKPQKTVDCSKHLYSSKSNQMEVRYGSDERLIGETQHLRQRRYIKVRSPTRPFGVFENGVYIPYLMWKGSQLPNCTTKSNNSGAFHGRGIFKRKNITQIPTTTPDPAYPNDEVIEEPEDDPSDFHFNMGKGSLGKVNMEDIKNKKVRFLSDDNGQGAIQEGLIGKKVNKKDNQAWTQKPNEAFTVKNNDFAETNIEAEPFSYYVN